MVRVVGCSILVLFAKLMLMSKSNTASKKRSILKTLSWRVIASGTTFALAWIVTGNLAIGATIGGLGAAAKMVFYYLHERAWHALDNRLDVN